MTGGFFFFLSPAAAPASAVSHEVDAGSGWRWWIDGWMDGWSGFVLTLLVVETAGLQLLYGSKVEHYTLIRRIHVPCRPVTSTIRGFHSIYLRLYSSLSLFTLARTLYSALISGVMVSIWTPTPSGCIQDTPGLVRRSAPGPNLRVWL